MTEKQSIPSAFKLNDINTLILKDEKGVLLEKGLRGMTVIINNDKVEIVLHDE